MRARTPLRVVAPAVAGYGCPWTTKGTVLWWSDRRSFDLRRTLAQELGLHGLALWRFGSADSLV